MRFPCFVSLACALLAIALPPASHAATFTVISDADSGPGSFRQALIDASADVTWPRVIRFDAPFPQGGIVELQSTLPTWSNDMLEIDGNGLAPVLDGGGQVRILTVAEGARHVTLRGLTLRNGRSTAGMGGCLWHQSTAATTDLYVVDARFEGCGAIRNNGDAYGGAIGWISPDSVVFIHHSTFIGNAVAINGNSTPSLMAGGALVIQGRNLQIAASRFADNTIQRFGGVVRGMGGAAYLIATDLVLLRDVEFESNKVIDADGGGDLSAGGAAVLACADAECPVVVTNASFIDNTISGNANVGGGIATIGNVALLNSSFSGNHAIDGTGGALFALGGELKAEHLSFQGNQADTGAHLALEDMNVIRWTWSLLGPVAADSGTSCDLDATTLTGPSAANLFESACGLLSDSGATIGPVGPLALDRSVFPATLAPGAGSPAIDPPGAQTHCYPLFDARGVTRPQDGDGDGIALCDVGAFETLPPLIFADGFEAAP